MAKATEGIDKATDIIAKLLRSELPSEIRAELDHAQEILLAILTN